MKKIEKTFTVIAIILATLIICTIAIYVSGAIWVLIRTML